MTNNPFGMQPQENEGKRLAFAVLLLSLIWISYASFFAPEIPVKQESTQTKVVENKKKTKVEKPKNTKNNSESLQAQKIPLQIERFNKDVKQHIDADLAKLTKGGYKASISNHGAQLTRFELTGYNSSLKEKNAKSNFINLAGGEYHQAQLFALESRNENLSLSANTNYKVIEKSADKVHLRAITPQNIEIDRIFKFLNNQFIVEQEIVIANNAKTVAEIELDLLLVSKKSSNSSSSFFGPQADDLGTVCRSFDKRERFTFDDLEKEKKQVDSRLKYAGFDHRYFLVGVIPYDISQTQGCSASAWSYDDNNKGTILKIHQTPIKLQAGQRQILRYKSYLGPKQLQLVSNASSELDENIDFGWFGVLSRPMLWLLLQIFSFVGNYGIAIILLTLLIKLLTFPLTQKSFTSMQAAKKYAPKLKELQKKYGHDRELLARKQMAFYKEMGINPVAGCLPTLMQAPIWIALYQMLWNSVELYQQPFFGWITDLTQPDPYFIFPVAMGVTMFIQMATSPTPQDQPQMKYAMRIMPIFLTFIMLNLPAGLSIYMFVNNLLSIAQQVAIKKKFS